MTLVVKMKGRNVVNVVKKKENVVKKKSEEPRLSPGPPCSLAPGGPLPRMPLFLRQFSIQEDICNLYSLQAPAASFPSLSEWGWSGESLRENSHTCL